MFSTSGVTTPYRKKSYHSIVVPIALANATLPGEIAALRVSMSAFIIVASPCLALGG
ncbi:hypothetical protein [Bradyrhizobium erythrophlei]|uniref:hypothetical protein n=1 Tax=Bradyrhizobium erythrophlei TaxID=1437360 RepID=UPI001FD9E8B3|nr:hypothetical protein [Bradyrhizobium erythrophlei]